MGSDSDDMVEAMRRRLGAKPQQRAERRWGTRGDTNSDDLAERMRREAVARSVAEQRAHRERVLSPTSLAPPSAPRPNPFAALGAEAIGRAGESIQSISEQIAKQIEGREAAAAVETASNPLLEFQRLSAPDRASYVKPFDDAAAAANESYGMAKGVINDTYGGLVGNLNTNQAEYEAEAAQLAKEQAMARRLAASQQDQALQSSVLESELGVDGAVQGEVALLKELQRQAMQGSDQSAAALAANQDAEHASRLQGVEGSKAAAQSNAAVNLSALLSEIGLGKAGAERQYAADLNRVQQANQQAEAQARAAYQKQLEDEAKAEEQYHNDNLKLLKQYEVDPWDGQNLNLRLANNPKATKAFLGFVDLVGGSRDGRGKVKALQMLPDMIQQAKARGMNLREDVLRNWIDEYYSNRKIIDEVGFRNAGGDPRFLG